MCVVDYWAAKSATAFRMCAAAWLSLSAMAQADEPSPLPPEVRKIQQQLGGPMVDKFPELRPTQGVAPWWQNFNSQPGVNAAPTPVAPPAELVEKFATPAVWPTWSAQRPARVQPATAVASDQEDRKRVHALRESAAQLEVAANRLEDLEMYRQADALRTMAQRLRVDARSLLGGGATTWSDGAVLPSSGPTTEAAPAASPDEATPRRDEPDGSWFQAPADKSPQPSVAPAPDGAEAAPATAN